MDELDRIMLERVILFLGNSDEELRVSGLDRLQLRDQALQLLNPKKEGDPK